MKNFNSVCMVTLLACGTYCTSSLHAEPTELTEHYNDAIDSNISTNVVVQTINDEVEFSHVQDTSNSTDETNTMHVYVDEDIADDVEEVTVEVAVTTHVNTNDVAVVVVAVAPQQAISEDSLDTMVDELVQSGAVEDDISVLENQPKWKLLLTRIGSYALAMGVSCKELLTSLYGKMQTSLENYWSNKDNA